MSGCPGAQAERVKEQVSRGSSYRKQQCGIRRPARSAYRVQGEGKQDRKADTRSGQRPLLEDRTACKRM